MSIRLRKNSTQTRLGPGGIVQFPSDPKERYDLAVA
jgi:hypothetical protein